MNVNDKRAGIPIHFVWMEPIPSTDTNTKKKTVPFWGTAFLTLTFSLKT